MADRPAAPPVQQPSRNRPDEAAADQPRSHPATGAERPRPRRGWRWFDRLGAALFVVALPVALISTNVRVFFTTPPLYTFTLDTYDVPAVTGIPREELARAMAELREYFTNDEEVLRITVTDEAGRISPLFTPREVIHMRDVKQLVQKFFAAQWIAAAVAAGYAAALLLARRGSGLRRLARLTRASMIGTLVFALIFSVAVLTGFDELFTRFHIIFFPNGLWQLDPARDRLLQMFPDGFWHVSTTMLAGLTIVEILALLALSWAYLRRAERRIPVEPLPSP